MSAHRESFTSLVQAREWKAGAELGVDKGILFGMLLRQCPSLERLIGVDTFPDPTRSHRVFALEQEYPKATVMRMSTTEAALHVPDHSLDFVFIDADHSQEAVIEDIANWQAKVKPGGWFGGHDYSPRFPGVIKAVDSVFGKPQRWEGAIWGVWL